MKFMPENSPFPYWLGPYSPARGNRKSGFRIKGGQLGVWMEDSFCVVQKTEGVLQLATMVKQYFGGGRVRVTVGGHAITNRKIRDGCWRSFYVGKVEPSQFAKWGEWIQRRKV